MQADGAEGKGEQTVATGGSRAPQGAILESIVESLHDNPFQTMGDLFRNNHRYPWRDFLAAANYLINQGLIEGKGDGFVVHYNLTPKGRTQLGPEK